MAEEAPVFASRPPETPVEGDTARKSASWGLPMRVITGILFVPVLVLLAQVGEWAFLFFIALQVALGLVEFYRMMRGRGLRPYRRLGIVSAVVMLWVCYRPQTPHVGFLITGVLMLVLALELRNPEARQRVENIAVTAFGVLYVGWLSAHLVLLRELPWHAGTSYEEGTSFVLLAFFVTWSCDVGAYAFGRLFGRIRPWRAISPRKSLEGAIGGFTMAVLAGLIARVWFAPFLKWGDAAVLGLLVGVFAQVGDLVESLLKRDAAHGDSSDMIPGHGGVLDRFDSLYFAAPVVYYYLRIVVFQVP